MVVGAVSRCLRPGRNPSGVFLPIMGSKTSSVLGKLELKLPVSENESLVRQIELATYPIDARVDSKTIISHRKMPLQSGSFLLKMNDRPGMGRGI